ncbi:hypothetical protein LTR17_014436 [Elasticomyces elasticus]|nr:hypothetical protein LTR17_014436 [Elasticomyces elasticus]
MGKKAWVIPVAVLGAIVALGLIFVWWWFPRAWKKGDKDDMVERNELAGPAREAQRQHNRDIIERYTRALAIERGEIVEDGVDSSTQPPPPPAYDHKTGTEAQVAENR